MRLLITSLGVLSPNKAFEQTPPSAAISFFRTGRSSTPRR